MIRLLHHRRLHPHPGGMRSRGSRAPVLLAIFSLMLVGVTTWGTVLTPTADASSSCRPRLEGSTVVVVVVKNGAASLTQRCVELTGTVNGFDALRAAGHNLRIEGGFLCAIDGVPATGCATASSFDGTYWRYFTSRNDGAWSYSPVGAGRRLGTGCMAEGWTYSDAAGAGQPPVNPAPVVPCEVAPVPTTTLAPVTPPTTAQPPVKTPSPTQSTPTLHTPTVGPVSPGGHQDDVPISDPSTSGAVDPEPRTQNHGNDVMDSSDVASGLAQDAERDATASQLDADGGETEGNHDESGSENVENTQGPERIEADEFAAAAEETNSGSIVGTVVVLIIVGFMSAVWWKRKRSMVENTP